MKLKYNDIYLVAVGQGIHSEHRVTGGAGRPGVIQFAGMRPDENGEPMGTLVLNEKKWNEWFGKREKLTHLETAAMAAQWFVEHVPYIKYGCPFCATRFSDYETMKEHIEMEAENIFKMFDVVEE
jgi:hypothetical protein